MVPSASLSQLTQPPIQIGILTAGKPTLAMVLVSLIMQEAVPIDIYIVDTAQSPVIKRDDVVFAMRLAFDRGVRCGYEYSKERGRAFSVGRLKLLQELKGPYISFVDDDIVLPPRSFETLMAWSAQRESFGFVSPVCRNYGDADNPLPGRPHYSPGGLIWQDNTVRSILLEYYESTVDVLDAKGHSPRLWEKAFLSELFPSLGREAVVLDECSSYHLDYKERPLRHTVDERVVTASVARAREMAQKALLVAQNGAVRS
ncbi:MAG: glycosyltransferase family A protein [Chloroflexota bacterium]